MKIHSLATTFFLASIGSIASAAITCPPMPKALTEVNKDVKGEISSTIGTLGKLKGAELGIKAESVAKGIFEKYPNVDKLIAIQTMSATYCQMLQSSAISDIERLDRWERFQGKVLEQRVNTPPQPQNTTKANDLNTKREPQGGKTRKPLPGDTGWIFAGYFNVEHQNFVEGPYVSVENTTKRGMRRYIEIGDTIGLKVSRDVHIVDYKKTGVSQKLVPPIDKGIIDEYDKTGITLPVGTKLVIRDISEGRWPDNPNAALWLRVVYVPQ